MDPPPGRSAAHIIISSVLYVNTVMVEHKTQDSVSQSYIYLHILIKYITFLKTDGRINVSGEHDPVSLGKVLPSITTTSLNILHWWTEAAK